MFEVKAAQLGGMEISQCRNGCWFCAVLCCAVWSATVLPLLVTYFHLTSTVLNRIHLCHHQSSRKEQLQN